MTTEREQRQIDPENPWEIVYQMMLREKREREIEEAMKKRPFEEYLPQPDTAERIRREVQSIPFAIPERKPA